MERDERRPIGYGLQRQRQVLDAAGAEVTWEVEDTAHLLGGCRMGDASTSVVDAWCRAWDVPNLFICDGSVFVTSSAANPSLAIQAIARRTATYLKRVAGRGQPRSARAA